MPAGIKKYISKTTKKKKQHDKIALLATARLNIVEVLLYKALIDSNISQIEFVVIYVLKKYKMKEEIINPNNLVKTISQN